MKYNQNKLWWRIIFMATFSEYVLGEPNFIRKVEIVHFMQKKQPTIFFNNSVILKAEIAREFVDIMRLDVDKNSLVTACLVYSFLKVDSPEEPNRAKEEAETDREFFKTLGFSDDFCQLCSEYNRALEFKTERKKESDILEIVDQFGAMLVNRQDRLAYNVEEALFMLEQNLRKTKNKYLNLFRQFVLVMEDLKVGPIGLLTKYQKEMNCLARNDISGAIRELYNNQERIEKAFSQRRKEFINGGDLEEEIRKARAKLELLKSAPMLPGFSYDDLNDED